MLHKALTYCYEMLFAVRHADGLRGKGLLALKTLQYHWHNWRGRPGASDSSFTVTLRFGKSTVSLTLRPYAGDLFVFYEVFAEECYALPESVMPTDQVRTIVDCGANIGLTALFFADRYPNAKIIAIEPHPRNFALLQANTRCQPRIVPIQACVAGDLATPRFITLNRPAYDNQMNTSGEGVEVPVETIDSLCAKHGLGQIDVLKVDIEGAERELFAKADFLPRIGIILIELHGEYGINSFRDDVGFASFSAYAPNEISGVKMVVALAPGHENAALIG